MKRVDCWKQMRFVNFKMTFMNELGVSVFNIDKSFKIILIALNFFPRLCNRLLWTQGK